MMSLPVWSHVLFIRRSCSRWVWSQEGGLVLVVRCLVPGQRGGTKTYKNITFQQLRLWEVMMTVAFHHLLHAIKLHSISVNLFYVRTKLISDIELTLRVEPLRQHVPCIDSPYVRMRLIYATISRSSRAVGTKSVPVKRKGSSLRWHLIADRALH